MSHANVLWYNMKLAKFVGRKIDKSTHWRIGLRRSHMRCKVKTWHLQRIYSCTYSSVVGVTCHVATLTRPVRMEELSLRLVDTLIRMSAEVITLPLQQISWQTSPPIPIEERKSSHESRDSHTVCSSHTDGLPPSVLCF